MSAESTTGTRAATLIFAIILCTITAICVLMSPMTLQQQALGVRRGFDQGSCSLERAMVIEPTAVCLGRTPVGLFVKAADSKIGVKPG